MSSLIGKSLQGGKYKLESVLGRGGFGLTFRAHQTYLDQVVVIKTLHESYWSAPNLSDLQRQFQDEARRLALCSHPNVVRVSDFFIEDGLPYMVMDYIPGRSLADIVLPSNPLPVKASVDYISQIGRALQAVHAKGLLHRDVKPQNIMIHQLTGEAILIDFGIARELTQNPTQTHTSIVSEGYAPIEQYLPKAHRSAATDVYGLAATLYTLLTAEVPVAAVLRDRNPLVPIQQRRPDVSGQMAAAIAQGMNIELKDRPQSVGRWLTMLTEKQGTGLFGRSKPVGQFTNGQPLGQTTMPQSTAQSTAQPTAQPTAQSTAQSTAVDGYIPHPSEVPTQVAVPGYRSVQQGPSHKTGGRTVAMPIPTGYRERVYRPAMQPPLAVKPAGQGLGCGAILGLITLGILGVLGGIGFWAYQQFASGLPEMPELSLPEIEIPEVKVPEPTEDEQNIPVENPDAEAEANDEELDTEPEYIPLPDSSAGESSPTEPPLLLDNSGNPADAKPGDTSDIVPVPGFPPGTSEEEIKEQLGAPTQESSTNGFYTNTYTLIPNRATLGYLYDQGSTQVRQSEAAFSPSFDRVMMRTTMIGMLDGRSSKALERGLEAVRKGDRDRVPISSGGFTGAIERNANGYIHIYVQE